MTPLIETINTKHLKTLSLKQLKELAKEIRQRIIEVVSINGGHLSSNLGVVELTIALHFVFDSPKDEIIFDVGHQSYVHKILTGRNKTLNTLRQTYGISGFTSPDESIHDHFYAGHAGNALSLALGVAKDRDLKKKKNHIIPLIGDASLTCGLTLEAMNNIPQNTGRFITILNDNAMSISKNVGAIKRILGCFNQPCQANHVYFKNKEKLKSASLFFEQFGLSYVGPIDGHDLSQLIDTFTTLKHAKHPVLTHVLTVKGKGMQNAVNNPTSYHGAKPFDPISGKFYSSKSHRTSFPKVFGKEILLLGKKHPNLVAITPAMPVGSCLDAFMKQYPDRCIDVGIAEGHAVTYAAGIGANKQTKVIACIYSSFIQRAFDNIYHDVCVQKSPVIFAIDRAGLACGDGVTAQGIFDIAFLNAMPGLIITQPRNGHMLKELLQNALDWNSPVAVRYPNLPTEDSSDVSKKRLIGKGDILSEGEEVVIISLGHMSSIALDIKKRLLKNHINAMVIDPVFIKPLDTELLSHACEKAKLIVTIEEHSLNGGLGSIINHFILETDCSQANVLNFGIPDRLISHGSHKDLLKSLCLSPEHISRIILSSIEIPENIEIG